MGSTPAKNKGLSHSVEANFEKGARPVRIFNVDYRILRIRGTLVHPLSLDGDTHTSVALKLHNGIRGIRFPTDHAISDGQVCTADLQRGGQAEIPLSPFARSGRETERRKVLVHRFGVILGNICLPTEKANDLCRQYLAASALRSEDSASRLTTHPLNRYPTGLPAGLLAQLR